MSLFRRKPKHIHDWGIVAVQTYWTREAGFWSENYGPKQYHTKVHYVCRDCKDTISRTEMGTFTIAEVKVVFPKP